MMGGQIIALPDSKKVIGVSSAISHLGGRDGISSVPKEKIEF